MKKLRVGFIGLGHRGKGLIKTALRVPTYDIVAVCDVYQDRVEAAAEIIKEATGKKPFMSTEHSAVINNPGVDAVIISTSWETHVQVAIEALEAGKRVGMEVGGAYNIEELCYEGKTLSRFGCFNFNICFTYFCACRR